MRVDDLINRKPVVILATSTVAQAATLMLENHLSGLPVLNAQGRLVGMLTEGDLLRRAEIGTASEPRHWLRDFLLPSHIAAEYVATHSRHVTDVMTQKPVFVAPETALSKAAQLMLETRIKLLPVLQDQRLVGVISRADLLRALAQTPVATPLEASDEAIGRYIKTELERARCAPATGLNIDVKEKIVDLQGVVFNDEERRAVRVIAENAPGVRGVLDHLVFVDPTTGMSFPEI